MNFARRLISLAIASTFLVGPITAEEVNHDTERRLSEITVTTLPPDKGMLHVNPMVIREQDFARPGVETVELIFAPVRLDEAGVLPAMEDEDRDTFKILTHLPLRAVNMPFKDTARDYRTSKVVLPRGVYVLSQINYLYGVGTMRGPDDNALSYCLSEGSFVFNIQGQDTLFMGLLKIAYPPEDIDQRRSFSPLALLGQNVEKLRGWRWVMIENGTKDLLSFDARPVQFEPVSELCSSDSHRVSAWQDDGIN